MQISVLLTFLIYTESKDIITLRCKLSRKILHFFLSKPLKIYMFTPNQNDKQKIMSKQEKTNKKNPTNRPGFLYCFLARLEIDTEFSTKAKAVFNFPAFFAIVFPVVHSAVDIQTNEFSSIDVIVHTKFTHPFASIVCPRI